MAAEREKKAPSAASESQQKAPGSSADGVNFWSLDLGLEGQVEQWQGPARSEGALLAPLLWLLVGRHQREEKSAGRAARTEA